MDSFMGDNDVLHKATCPPFAIRCYPRKKAVGGTANQHSKILQCLSFHCRARWKSSSTGVYKPLQNPQCVPNRCTALGWAPGVLSGGVAVASLGPRASLSFRQLPHAAALCSLVRMERESRNAALVPRKYSRVLCNHCFSGLFAVVVF